MKTIFKPLILLLLFALIISAKNYTSSGNVEEIDTSESPGKDEVKIAVNVAKVETINPGTSLNLIGESQPEKEVVVTSETSGKITDTQIKLGTFVNKGTVLARVNDTYKQLTVDNAELVYQTSKEELERLTVLYQGSAVSEEQVRDARNTLKNAEIQLKTARQQLADTKITAPFSGIITGKLIEKGSYVTSGSGIAELVDISSLKVLVFVSEKDAYQLSEGQSVNIFSKVNPEISYEGNISGISPKANNQLQFLVEILMVNPETHPMKAGTLVEVNIDTKEGEPLLMLPRAAILSSVKAPSVYVVQADSVHMVELTTGLEYQSYIEVVSGVKEGDLVVTSGQINLSEGAKISIIQ